MFPMAKRVIAGFFALCECRRERKKERKSDGGDGGKLDHYIYLYITGQDFKTVRQSVS